MSEEYRVLLADDDKDLAKSLEEMLEGMGTFRIVTANDGAQAYAKAKNEVFDLLILDYQMPQMSGPILLESLRALKANAQVPCIFVTGFARDTYDVCKERKLLNNVYIFSKPYKPEKIVERAFAACQTYTYQKSQKAVSGPKLNVDFINAFFHSLASATQKYTDGAKVNLGSPKIIGIDTPQVADMTLALQVSSPSFTGEFAISYPSSTFLKMAEKIFKKNFQSIDHEARNAAGEFAKLVFGNTVEALNSNGYYFDQSVPQLIHGGTHKVPLNPKDKIFLAPLNSSLGEFWAWVKIPI